MNPNLRSDGMLKAAFSFAVLLNAFLIFWVELFFAKRLLPSLGGSPAVWNTSLMFYQVVLMAGYGYVLLVDRLPPRRQFGLHAGLILLAVAALPWGLFLWSDPPAQTPVFWLLALLSLSLGPFFFVLATGAPLLQRWFSRTGHREGGDPYFLYAASNIGSFLALAAYPLLIEPRISLTGQTTAWKLCFLVVGVLVLVGGGAMLRRASALSAFEREGPEDPASRIPVAPIAPLRRWRWILLSFVPSSLLLGVTTHITGEIAPVPLLWVVPLGLYLLTFILAFGTRLGGAIGGGEGGGRAGGEGGGGEGSAVDSVGGEGFSSSRVHLVRRFGAIPALVLAAATLWFLRGQAAWLLILGDLAILAAAGIMCHGRLARDRPAPERLPEFYLWLAVGGALGGVFNTLLAPLLFEDPLEFPLVLALFAFLASGWGRKVVTRPRVMDLVLGALPGAVALLLAHLAGRAGMDPGVALPVAGLSCLLIAGRPFRFGLGVAGLVLVGFSLPVESGSVVFRERTFFGIHRIYADEDHRWLAHGSTVHGGERLSDPGTPLTYYHPDGPAGSLFRAFQSGTSSGDGIRIAAVGLGTGSLLSYSRTGETWDLFELDPMVAEIAENPAYFTFLQNAQAGYEVVLGDARRSLEIRESAYDLIVVDAFSSDAIPVHLLTREALQLYRARLRPGGWIAFHTSNRYADFSSVLATLATAEGLDAYEGVDEWGDPTLGRYPSRWVLLAGAGEDPRVVNLAGDRRWQRLAPQEGEAWTDDHSSILEVLRR